MSPSYQTNTVTSSLESGLHRISWVEHDQSYSIIWHSENQTGTPKKICRVDDRINADQAYKLACEGCALLWTGDYHQARQLLLALSRRIEKKQQQKKPSASLFELFHKNRQAQAQKARILGMLLIPFAPNFRIELRRAPEVSETCQQVFDATYSTPAQQSLKAQHFCLSLRELLGLIGAYEWRKNGVMIDALRQKIHPYYGVFSPVRGEYLSLIQEARLAKPAEQIKAFDIGTGTGVIAAILARRGITEIIATDQDARALACAEHNLRQLKLEKQVRLAHCDLFPDAKADLIVCNPPWLPVKPGTAIEYALYDENSQMLKRFLAGLQQHLTNEGEAWLIMSDLAELLGLRAENDLTNWIQQAGLAVKSRSITTPRHHKSQDQSDPLFAARSKEVTSLWCLQVAQ